MTSNDITIANVRSLSLLASLLFITIISTQADQSYERQPEGEYRRLRGENLVLPCVVRNRVGQCFWLRNGIIVSNVPNKYTYDQSPLNGDCSLHIKGLDHVQDEGEWQCQVTAAAQGSQALKANARIMVLVTPNPPHLNGLTNGNLRVQADRPHEVECVSTGGNPASRIEWYINGQNVTENSKTKIDPDHNRLPRVTSTLNHTFKRNHRNATITCLSIHPIVTQNSSGILDVLYSPQVSVPQKSYTVTEGANLDVPCIVDSNPHLTGTWHNLDGSASPGDYHTERSTGTLKLHSITKKLNGAKFECRAKNDYGGSQDQITLDVLFEPTLTDSTKNDQRVELGSSIELYCNYQGNPEPKIMWFHINPITDQVTTRDNDPETPGRLRLTNVTYHDEGHYYCELLNHNPITNTDKIVRSARMVVDVTGKPAVVQKPAYASGYRGTATDVEQIFCSDPAPTTVYWTYGSLRIDVPQTQSPPQLQTPSNNGNQNLTKSLRHKAQPLMALERHQSQVKCFRTILTITNTDVNDERDYTLVVENARGMTESVISLKVKSPISAAIMITIGLIVLIMLLALTLVTTLVIKRRKLAKEKADDESKAEARAPMNSDTDKPEKEPEKNKGENHELVYANLDFVAKPEAKAAKGKPQAQQRQHRTANSNGSGSATEYAQIQFANKADL